MNPNTTPATPEQIAWYYDQNTPRFLRFGGSGDVAAIHRQIWAPGVENAEQAFLYLNHLVAEAISPAISPAMPDSSTAGQALDLGCGVGGTTTWLAQHLGTHTIGVTNSAVQHQLALERAERMGLQGQCRFELADFLALPDLGGVDAAFAIESFIHAGDPRRFFEQVALQLQPGGRLVICDDFLSEELAAPGANPGALRWVKRFQEGWHLNNLLPVSVAVQVAQQAGFHLLQAHNLTPYLRHFHPLVLWPLAYITRLPLRSAYWQNLAGGTALQICAMRNWTQYQALVWEKPA